VAVGGQDVRREEQEASLSSQPVPEVLPKLRNVLLVVSGEHSPRYMGCSKHRIAVERYSRFDHTPVPEG